MKGKKVHTARCVAIVAGFAASLPAQAIPVFDLPNFAINLFNAKTLISIEHQLKDKSGDTVNYNTSITADIDLQNIEISNDFTWIINKGGDEIIPIPKAVKDRLDKIMDWENTDAFTSQFKSAADYDQIPEGADSERVKIDGSRARKAANDALITTLSVQRNAFNAEFEDLRGMADKVTTTTGHGNQMQIANAMSTTQINQLMKLRSMMLVSEASRAVEAQVAADRDARAIAVGKRLNDGLDRAASQSLIPLSQY
ncbi:MAG TPA: hypothetical protein VN813_05760 [Luteibacter sp.]|nr:hypothetical protein [Luteibacter sp.]